MTLTIFAIVYLGNVYPLFKLQTDAGLPDDVSLICKQNPNNTFCPTYSKIRVPETLLFGSRSKFEGNSHYKNFLTLNRVLSDVAEIGSISSTISSIISCVTFLIGKSFRFGNESQDFQ